MAYQRKNGNISFSYDSDDLFDIVAMQSSYISRNIKDKEGNYTGEEFVLTHDEDDAYNECFRKCANTFINMFPKMCLGFNIEEGLDIEFTDNGVRESILKLVDQEIQDILIYGILCNWYEVCSDVKLVEYCRSVQTEKLKKMWNDMFLMRNKE